MVRRCVTSVILQAWIGTKLEQKDDQVAALNLQMRWLDSTCKVQGRFMQCLRTVLLRCSNVSNALVWVASCQKQLAHYLRVGKADSSMDWRVSKDVHGLVDRSSARKQLLHHRGVAFLGRVEEHGQALVVARLRVCCCRQHALDNEKRTLLCCQRKSRSITRCDRRIHATALTPLLNFRPMTASYGRAHSELLSFQLFNVTLAERRLCATGACHGQQPCDKA
mmetsp:Transcript_126947/g.223457  ORF Transcript_126947/g.223457 Transcript_126947/m.223457 type:complete len:222 (-) Transcript_126947:101-766(-)